MNVILHIDGVAVTLENVTRKAQAISFTLGAKQYQFRSQRVPGGGAVLEQCIAQGIWQRTQGTTWQAKQLRKVQLGSMEAAISERAASGAQGGGPAELSPRAPMPGQICQVLVKAGDKVEKGQALVVLEAMKLQTTLSAGADATVEMVMVAEGDRVNEGDQLVVLNASAKIS